MANNVFKEAKKMRKAHPRKFKKWSQYVKAAGSKVKKGRGKSAKKVSGVKKKTTTSKKVETSVGSIASHKAAIRKGLSARIDRKVIARHKATRKTEKKKLTRDIRQLESEQRKFC
jgi:hypothetical protein